MTIPAVGLPVTPDEIRRAAGSVLEHPGADGVEVLVMGSSVGLTRYARSEIIQNTTRLDVRAQVRVHVGERVATAATNQLDPSSLRATADLALEAARSSPVDPEFPGLAEPDEAGTVKPLFRWDDATAGATPEARAAQVRALVERVAAPAHAAGIFETGAHAYGLVSSRGLDRFDAFTRASTTCLVEFDGATGWADASGHEVATIDAESVAAAAVRKARSGTGATRAEPGGYQVVLEPSAVGVLLEYLAYIGFGAKQVIEGESFLAARAGERVAAPDVTVADDVSHPRSVGIAFDFEGVARSRVPVIESGTARGPVTDLRTARQLRTSSTGHNSGSNEFGPYPFNVVLEPGTSAAEELIAGVDDGLLVTRFHYVNVLDWPATLLTGMTRDGTFRIRGGEVAEPVHNFRFAQSALGALDAVSGIGSEVASFAPEFGHFGSVAAPALRIDRFDFSSVTTY